SSALKTTSSKPLRSRWARRSVAIFIGSWSGTRRKSTFAVASHGITVFDPGPLYPDSMPQTLQVGSNTAAYRTSSSPRPKAKRSMPRISFMARGSNGLSATMRRSASVGLPGVEREEPPEVRAPRLLLTFDEEADPDRQLAEHRAVRFDRLDAEQQVSLVVVDAARVHRAVAHRRLVRRRLPEREGHRR